MDSRWVQHSPRRECISPETPYGQGPASMHSLYTGAPLHCSDTSVCARTAGPGRAACCLGGRLPCPGGSSSWEGVRW
jgi:hypothetical protein